MIALHSYPVDASKRSIGDRFECWMKEVEIHDSDLALDRRRAVDLLLSPNDKLRELAVLSFHYRWPIDDEVFQRIRPIAGADSSLEIRAAAIALYSAIHLLCKRTDREAVRAALAEAARWPGQNEDIAEFADMFYRATEDPSQRSNPATDTDWDGVEIEASRSA